MITGILEYGGNTLAVDLPFLKKLFDIVLPWRTISVHVGQRKRRTNGKNRTIDGAVECRMGGEGVFLC